MAKKTWDLFAPVYQKAMGLKGRKYQQMYQRICLKIQNKDVLEIAAGTGILAKEVAKCANKMIATDYSKKMIQQAQKSEHPKNLSFEVADAKELPFDDKFFDVVIIANALHIMPESEKALKEIGRVLKDNGLLIAPNYVFEKNGMLTALWFGILKIARVKFEHHWAIEGYRKFLGTNGWQIIYEKTIKMRVPMLYVECVR